MDDREDYDDGLRRPRWLRRGVVEVVAVVGLSVAALVVYCVVVPRLFPWLPLD